MPGRLLGRCQVADLSLLVEGGVVDAVLKPASVRPPNHVDVLSCYQCGRSLQRFWEGGGVAPRGEPAIFTHTGPLHAVQIGGTGQPSQGVNGAAANRDGRAETPFLQGRGAAPRGEEPLLVRSAPLHFAEAGTGLLVVPSNLEDAVTHAGHPLDVASHGEAVVLHQPLSQGAVRLDSGALHRVQEYAAEAAEGVEIIPHHHQLHAAPGDVETLFLQLPRPEGAVRSDLGPLHAVEQCLAEGAVGPSRHVDVSTLSRRGEVTPFFVELRARFPLRQAAVRPDAGKLRGAHEHAGGGVGHVLSSLSPHHLAADAADHVDNAVGGVESGAGADLLHGGGLPPGVQPPLALLHLPGCGGEHVREEQAAHQADQQDRDAPGG